MTSPNRRIYSICSKEIILIILWDALMYFQVYTLLLSIDVVNIHTSHEQSYYNIVIDITFCLIFLIFPFFGLLADIKTGRYKSIIIGVYISFIAWIIGGLAVIVNSFITLKPLYLSSLFFYLILQSIGYCTVRSNIVQFNIDQSVGASANQLSSIIYWHFVGAPIVLAITKIGKCLFNKFALVSYIVSGVAVCTVIITNHLFKHWLDTTPHNINPIKLIAKVLNYAWNNKYPRNRSALTYWEEDYPSRLDLGKEKYGGPFSVEEVEDVKTVLRLIPLLICIIGGRCVEDYGWNLFNHKVLNSNVISCLVVNESFSYLVSSILLFFYHFVICRCFHNCNPSMLKRLSVGLIFTLFYPVSYLIIILCQRYLNVNVILFKVILSQILLTISYSIIFPISFEFTIAQCPHQMRGFMVSLWYAAHGIGLSINNICKYSFKCEAEMICQSNFYYLVKSLVVLITLISFLVLAKRYKLRVRDNEVNIHLIAEEHYERYMNQEIEYRKEVGLSLESTD